jgi:hypothetical protein
MAALVEHAEPHGLKIKIDSIDEQRELFLWRFKDVARADVTQLFNVINIYIYILLLLLLLLHLI